MGTYSKRTAADNVDKYAKLAAENAAYSVERAAVYATLAQAYAELAKAHSG